MVFIIKKVEFEDIESLVCDITNKFDSLTDEFGDVSVIAKYDEAKEIIKELICFGYDVASLEIHKEEFEEYWDEYIISISKENDTPIVWCEKFKRENGYFTEESSITYVLDNCNSKCLAKIKSPIQYEITVGIDDECAYTNCDCESDCEEYSGKDDDGTSYHITIKGDLDLDEAYAKLDEMEARIVRISDMFNEITYFNRLFRW